MPEKKILTVSDYLDLVNDTLALIPSEEIVVVGEVSDFRISQEKWINFDLKDEEQEAKISCFTTVFKLTMPLEDGMRVQVVGYPKVYERFGRFSFNVQAVELVGEGALARAYELLKKKLAQEGLFDLERKRPIPRFPEKIGLITSKEAAAYGDFLRILNNRWGGIEIIHTPVHVQGKEAVREILVAFERFEQLEQFERPEVIVLTRGGGSLEDLHAFNDEQVARAVFSSSVPVICGVGHERDESLCDFVADVRASTPSNAAEIVVPDRTDILKGVRLSLDRIQDLLELEQDRRARDVDHSVTVLDRFIEDKVHDLKIVLTQFVHTFERFRLQFESTKQALKSLMRLFENFDMQKVLERGFSIVRSKGKIIKDATVLAPGAGLRIQLARGGIGAKVTEVKDVKKVK
ncbi:exodeoxyribonuclease VII large subunit [Patescibacteria group bacterium]|nr:exodeoxyribonuclease VII large subunit [Patescibacteria group bacterium]